MASLQVLVNNLLVWQSSCASKSRPLKTVYGGREGSAASRVKKPKRQSKADVGNSKIEAAIENQEQISKYLCGISKSPLHVNL